MFFQLNSAHFYIASHKHYNLALQIIQFFPNLLPDAFNSLVFTTNASHDNVVFQCETHSLSWFAIYRIVKKELFHSE